MSSKSNVAACAALLATLASPILADAGSRYEIRLLAGSLRPEPGVKAASRQDLEARATKLRARGEETFHVLVQLHRVPDFSSKLELSAAGLDLGTYASGHAWIAAVPVDRLGAVLERPEVRWMTAWDARFKLHPRLAEGDLGPWSRDPERPGWVMLAVQLHHDVELAAGERLAEAAGGVAAATVAGLHGLTVWLPEEKLPDLAEREEVLWIEEGPPPLGPANDGVLSETGADVVKAAPFGLDGSGVRLLVFDSGAVRATHETFDPGSGSRVTVIDTAAVNTHATRVAGTAAGDGSGSAGGRGEGVATGADVLSAGYQQSDGTMPFWDNGGDLETDLALARNTHDADLANQSLASNVAANGYPCSREGDYGVASALLDDIVRGDNAAVGSAVLSIWSAGNERTGQTGLRRGRCGANYATTAPPACAKNPIQVGAANSDGSSMTAFSSWGPCDDGRLKPLVVAPGCETTLVSPTREDGILSALATGDSAYGVGCGSSFAAAATSGVAALLIEDWRALGFGGATARPLPALAKTLLMHTARDRGQDGPDFIYGYGAVDAVALIGQLRCGTTPPAALPAGCGTLADLARNWGTGALADSATDATTVTVPAGTAELRVSLAWDDPAAAAFAAAALVNDLDLEVVSPSAVVFRPFILDAANPHLDASTGVNALDNQEQVVVKDPDPGAWTVRVTGTSVPTGPQSYGLAWSVTPETYGCATTTYGWETGAEGWTLGGAAVEAAPAAGHGAMSLRLGGAPNTVHQAFLDVAVPAGTTEAELTYYAYLSTGEGGNLGNGYDLLLAEVRDAADTPLEVFDLRTDGWKDGEWMRQQNVDLAPYAGTTVRLAFRAANDPLRLTSFFVDDARTVICSPGTPTVSIAVDNWSFEDDVVGDNLTTSTVSSWTESGAGDPLTSNPTTGAVSDCVASSVVQLDVTPFFTDDVIVNNGAGPIDPTQVPIDAGTLAFSTQSVAAALFPADPQGLPDTGSFPANAFHPAVQLAYDNSDNGDNAWRTAGPATIMIPAAPAKYSQIHLFSTTGSGNSTLTATLNYTDLSTDIVGPVTVPDWFNDPAETASRYDLIDNRDRLRATAPFTYQNANDPAIFGLRFNPDTTKLLDRIDVARTGAGPVNNLFGATICPTPDFSSVPDGSNTARLDGATLSQVIAAETLLAGLEYELSVDVGDRRTPAFSGYTIQLVVDGMVRASASGPVPADGSFTTATASFVALPADAGKSLEIRLVSSGVEANFDNVRLLRSPIGNSPPTVAISAPATGSSFASGDTITFAGSATDLEDGDLSAGLTWSSSLDGPLAPGGASFMISTLSVGVHVITATVTDSGGESESASIGVTVACPALTFTSIAAEDGWLLQVRPGAEGPDFVGEVADADDAGGLALSAGDEFDYQSLGEERQYKLLTSFDTSGLPDDATVTAATLRLRRGGLVGTSPFTTHGPLRADIRTGAFGGSTALVASDWEAGANAAGVTTLSPAAADGDFSDGTLNAAGRAAVNLTGRTQLRAAFAVRNDGDGADDYVGFYSGESAAGNRPQLLVSYLAASCAAVPVTPPAFSKSFSPSSIATGGLSTLTFTVDNSANAVAVGTLAFSDTLPAAVTIASPSNDATTCGGTITLTAPGTIGFASGSVGAGATCTVNLDVTSSTAGTHTNTSGALTSDAGSSGTATADLTVTLPDAFVANNLQVNQFCTNDGAGSFTCVNLDTTARQSFGVEAGDLDGDGDQDAVFANAGSARNRVCLRTATFTCTDVSTDTHNSFDVALGDLDGDGFLDAVFANTATDRNRACFGDGAGAFSPCVDVEAAAGNSRAIAIGDLNGDGDPDLVFARFGGAPTADRLCVNSGSPRTVPFSCSNFDVASPRQGRGVALGDVDGDGNLDSVVANFTGFLNRVCFGDGAGGLGSCADVDGASSSRDVAVGDLDNDGDFDIVFANAFNAQANRRCLNNGLPRPGLAFACGDVAPAARDAAGVALGDVDADGDRDPVFANFNNGGASQANEVCANDGLAPPAFVCSTTFTSATPPDPRNSLDIALAPGSGPFPLCAPGSGNLCLNDSRFEVTARWRDFAGNEGSGRAVALSGDTGYFWFFDDANVELIVKVLDGRALNGHFWVFYGALSNVEFTLEVTDTETGAVKSYTNPAGRFASVGDTEAIPEPAGGATAPERPALRKPSPAGVDKTCAGGPESLCLQQSRFRLEVEWRDFEGNLGAGQAVNLSADTGYFWFFDDANVELVVKVLDGRALNDRFWVFYGALSNVEYTLTVTDTETGEQRTYFNPAGRFASAGDTDAF